MCFGLDKCPPWPIHSINTGHFFWLGMPSQQGSLLAIRKKGESQTKSATELRLKPLICCQMIQIYVESTMVESNSKSWYPNSWKTDVRPFRWCQNAITHSHMKHGETLLIPVGWLIRRANFDNLSMFSPKFDLVACKSHKTTHELDHHVFLDLVMKNPWNHNFKDLVVMCIMKSALLPPALCSSPARSTWHPHLPHPPALRASQSGWRWQGQRGLLLLHCRRQVLGEFERPRNHRRNAHGPHGY